jgi:hypothetical protein
MNELLQYAYTNHFDNDKYNDLFDLIMLETLQSETAIDTWIKENA